MSACNSQMGGMGECKQKLKKLQEIDFSLVDTILYLNAYPECAEAMKYYKKLKAEREELLKDMKEHACPPINAMEAANGGAWDWTDSPWPWEPDAN